MHLRKNQIRKLKRYGILPKEITSFFFEELRDVQKRIYRKRRYPIPRQFEVKGHQVISTTQIEL